MKYIKLFNVHSEYESYINSENKKLPNMSYCKIHEHLMSAIKVNALFSGKDYNDTLVSEICVFSHLDDNNTLGSKANEHFNKIIIDSIKLEGDDLDTNEIITNVIPAETHNVVYYFKNYDTYNCFIGNFGLSEIITLEFPEGFTTINPCTNYTNINNIILPESLIRLEDKAFNLA